MRGKPNRYKNKILVALVALFTMLMCTSVGFAAWITSGGGSSAVTGNIDADDYVETTSGEAQCISKLSVNSFRYAAGYGFANETTGKYDSSMTLTGTFTFDVSQAKTAIDTLVGSKQFSLVFEFTTSTTSNFTFGTPTFTGFTNSPVSKTVTSSATKSAAYNITLTNDEYNQASLSCGFSMSISYGSSLSSFPSLANTTYNVVITPGEALS